MGGLEQAYAANIIFLFIAKAKWPRYYGTHNIKCKPLGMTPYITRGVSHYGLAIYIKKKELCKFKCKNIPLKETKIVQDIIPSMTNLKFQHKPKYHLSKILTLK